AREIEDTAEMFHRSRFRRLAVEGDNAREDGGHLLRRVELARLLARAGGKLADEVLVGVAERINLGGELGQALVDLLDDLAELLVLLRLRLAKLFRVEVDLREEALESALEGLALDELEALVQGFQQRVAFL